MLRDLQRFIDAQNGGESFNRAFEAALKRYFEGEAGVATERLL